MRIGFGLLKGRKLLLQKSLSSLSSEIRPTTSFVRGVMFNILQHRSSILQFDIATSSVADVCCGTGVVGFEFLSLGAASCCFIDHDKDCLRSIKHNAKLLSVDDRVNIVFGNAARELQFHEKLHIVFIDPPYKSFNIIESFLHQAAINGSLHDGALIILEVSSGIEVCIPPCFVILHRRSVSRYVDLLFYRFLNDH